MNQLPSRQESPDDEELLAQSRSMSSAANYTSDSFESITDEPSWKYDSDSFESNTNESLPDYENDPFESFSHVDSHDTSFSESTSIISEAGKDILEERDIIEKWITILERKHQPSNLYRVHVKPETQEESTATGSPALQSYCSRKIKHLRKECTAIKQNKQHPGPSPSSSAIRNPSCVIPNQLMNRLQLQCMKETIKQVMQAEMHDPTCCPDCSHKRAELAESHFVRMKKTKLEASLLQMKLEEYIYSKDLVTCIGEIHQSLPKFSDICSDIWQRLYTKAKT